MKSRLIIIRGNSGSGKSTIATRLRQKMESKTMLIPQDMIRREILKVKDDKNNPSVKLIRDIALFGKSINYDVIIEGILANHKYGNMLKRLIKEFEYSFIYYLNVSFEETLNRHKTKINSHAFGENEMKDWWLNDDRLGVRDELILEEELSLNDIIKKILEDISK